MNFHVITLFPEVVDAYTNASILGRAQKEKKLSVKSYQLRDFVTNKWGKADERPYGGGPGMVLQAEPFVRAIAAIQKQVAKSAKAKGATLKVLVTSPGGRQLTNEYAKALTKSQNVVILCGRYEGIDARVARVAKALGAKVEEVSTGPYVLTGGELPALTIIDVAARQIPGVLGKFESLEEGRVASHEVYTRPEVFEYKDKGGKVKKFKVPKVLLSGNHADMEAWKEQKRSRPV